MDCVIIATFNNDKAAIDGLHKLDSAATHGDIQIYDRVMIRKGPKGDFEMLTTDSSAGWQTLTGLSIGGLAGLLGGPVGFIVGLSTGAEVGAFSDLGRYAFGRDFLNFVKDGLPVGTTSIIAHVSKASAVFIDACLEPLGATLTGSDIYTEQSRYVQTESGQLDAEIRKAEDDLMTEAQDGNVKAARA